MEFKLMIPFAITPTIKLALYVALLTLVAGSYTGVYLVGKENGKNIMVSQAREAERNASIDDKNMEIYTDNFHDDILCKLQQNDNNIKLSTCIQACFANLQINK